MRKRRIERGEAFLEGASNFEPGMHPEEDERLRNYKSHYGEFSSTQAPNKKHLGSIDGMSQIFRRSEDGDIGDRHLVDDDDTLHHYNEIKELFRSHFNSFDDLLQKMGKAAFTHENMVSFKDFETVVRSMSAAAKFSSQQLKAVFMTYAHGLTPNEASMRAIDFKDKFFPGYHWQRQPGTLEGAETFSNAGGPKSVTGESENRTESMHVDNILAGLRQDELKKDFSDAGSKDKARIAKIEQKYKVTSASGGMAPINEDRMEVASRSSATSQAIDDIITKGRDPRRNKFEPSGLAKIEEEKRGPPASLTQDDLRKFKQNQEFFRQNEAIIH